VTISKVEPKVVIAGTKVVGHKRGRKKQRLDGEPKRSGGKRSATAGRAPKYKSLDPRDIVHVKYAWDTLNRRAKEGKLSTQEQISWASFRQACVDLSVITPEQRERLIGIYNDVRKGIEGR